MAEKAIKRLPQVKTLYEMLPKGAESGKEFARIVDLLLFHEARRAGKKITLFSDSAGDYYGLDSFEGDAFRRHGTTGYQSGDESRANDLVSMVKSKDPQYREIFERCLWIPTAEEKKKEQASKKQKKSKKKSKPK